MKMWVRAVRLRAHTNDGPFGRTLIFRRGFNIVRGSNSRGKTQVVQAIIYGLGLERMLAARANTPLGSVLTSEIQPGDTATVSPIPVTSSWVAVEFENESNEIVTVQRNVKNPRIQSDLVRVWNGPALTDFTSAGTPKDLFLHLPGSASRDLGFHKLLTDILGWPLPRVPKYTGSYTQLYPDVLFPFIIVDQQSWGSAGPRKVERYQIREPSRRAVEFLLSLTGAVEEARRAELEQSMVALRTQWSAARTAVETLAATVGGRIVGVPIHAAGAQARSKAPEPSVLSDTGLQLLELGEWIGADSVIGKLAEQLQEIRLSEQRTIMPGIDDRTRRELDQAEGQLADILAAARLVEQDLAMGEAQLAALDRRLSMLQEERDRNRDVRTLVSSWKRGSRIASGRS